MKRTSLILLVFALVLLGTTVLAQEPMNYKIGLSWNRYDVTLVNAWETYMQSESVRQGEEVGVNVEWIITAADGDPARQAANIEDM
ncbi:MAG: hypothetical protein JNL42_19295, partial [Anaerolineae bacterium]|nr:hypothetical protein [Anaerolineae bacterium]